MTEHEFNGEAEEASPRFQKGMYASAYSAPSSPSGRGNFGSAFSRSSFIPPSSTPGPAAYSPNMNSVKTASAQPPFGSASRHNESHRFVSDAHNKTIPVVETPGPGTYRVVKSESNPNSPKHHAPAWGFGSAAQRPETSRPECPGAIYSQEPPKTAPSYTFAPQGSYELGMSRTRQDGQKMFLSKEHSRIDTPVGAQDLTMVGPGLYEVSKQEVLSPHKKAPVAVFGRSSREVKDSLLKDQLNFDPLATTAAETPGAIYDYPSSLSPKSNRFGSSPRMYAPEKGSSTAGPYMSRLHEESMRGTCSPGPGTYDVQGGRGKAVGGLGDGPTFPFGGVTQTGEMALRVDGPSPGTYNPKEGWAGPSFSMGANLRTDFAATSATGVVPGPGAYNVSDAAKKEGQIARAASYTMGGQEKGGRCSFVKPTCTPGPVYSPLVGTIEAVASGSKGFSMGQKEKKKDNTLQGFRYTGPLAAKEGLGTAGPGPIYDVSAVTKLSGKKNMPHLKIGTASREAAPRIFISKQHAEADGAGLDAPGPGTYDNHKKELASVTSKYRAPPSAVFSTTQRFASNYSTF